MKVHLEPSSWNSLGADSPSDSKLFSFSNSSGATFKTSKSTVNALITLAEPVIDSSPYNVTAIYNLVITFDEEVFQLFEKEKHTVNGRLKDFLNDFINNVFLKHVKYDFQKRIDRSIESADSFTTKSSGKNLSSYSSSEESRPLLKVSIFSIISF